MKVLILSFCLLCFISADSLAQGDTTICNHAFGYGLLLINGGRNQETYDTLTVYGDNDIEGSADVVSSTAVNIGNVDNNYWGGGSMSANSNVTFTDGSDLTSAPGNPGVVCSDGIEKAEKKHGQIPAQFQSDSFDCQASAQYGLLLLNDGNNQDAYDTLKAYIEHCYAQPLAYRAFGSLDGAMAGISAPDTKWLDFRKWLFKVLYLNRDTNYFCSDVNTMIVTFLYYGPRGYDVNGEIAVEKYIVESGKCPGLETSWRQNLLDLRKEDLTEYRDTVKDSIKTPYDSTLPSLKEIGFEILLGPDAMVNGAVIPKSVLGDVAVSPNPFNTDAEIKLTLNIPATLTVEVYDQLGARVRSLIPGVFSLEGDKTLNLSGKDLSSGVYYVRISVPEGEVRTVKVVRE